MTTTTREAVLVYVKDKESGTIPKNSRNRFKSHIIAFETLGTIPDTPSIFGIVLECRMVANTQRTT